MDLLKRLCKIRISALCGARCLYLLQCGGEKQRAVSILCVDHHSGCTGLLCSSKEAVKGGCIAKRPFRQPERRSRFLLRYRCLRRLRLLLRILPLPATACFHLMRIGHSGFIG